MPLVRPGDYACRPISLYTNEDMVEKMAIYSHLSFMATYRTEEQGFDACTCERPFERQRAIALRYVGMIG